MKIIVVTSMSYATTVDSPIPGSEVTMADVVIDNCAPAAEAMMEVEGLSLECAASTVRCLHTMERNS